MKNLPVTLSYFLVPCTTSLYSYFVQVRVGVCTNFKKLYGIKVKKEIGGARRDRTVDLYAASVALSQLSYGPNAYKVATQAARI